MIINNPKGQTSSKPITPVQWEPLKLFIQGYHYANYLLEGFSQGFYLGYEGPRVFRTSPNLNYSQDLPEIITQSIGKEVKLGRIKGPFTDPPYSNLQVSPVGCVPKKASNEYRMIYHLSYPKGASINTYICDELSTVQYASFDDAVQLLLNIGPNALMAKTDIEAAFRIIPIHPSDFELLGIFWNNEYYYDTCLPFGASSSCAIFERFSSGLQWVAVNKLGIRFIIHILDDFLIMGPPSSSRCRKDLDVFWGLCKKLGVPIKASKTFLPTTVLTFMGLVLDSVNMEARLPEDKLLKLQQLLKLHCKCRKITLRDLQSLLGFLNFCCLVVRPGRCFMRRLIDLTKGLSNRNFYITLNKEARKDLRAWLIFAESFNGRSHLLDFRWVSNDSLHLYTDAASSKGYAAIFQSHWLMGAWSKEHAKRHITFQELLPIVLAFEVWGHQLANKCISLHSDNMAVVQILNKQSSKEANIMFLVRRFVLCCMRNNILTKAYHIPGKKNILPDLISRFQVQEFHRLAPSMDAQPTTIPELIRDQLHL